MAQRDDPAEAARRLEVALERIERSAHAPRPPGQAQPDMSRLAARLDALIGELRAALGEAPGG